MYQNINLKNTLDEIIQNVSGNSVALFGGRFLSWVIAKELDNKVDEIIISDTDPWVERLTVENLEESLNATIISGNNDVDSSKKADSSIITSTIKSISDNISNKVPNALKLV